MYLLPSSDYAHLVRALSLDVTWLLALVASSLAAGLGWAISGQVTDLTAIVALLALGTITAHVSIASAAVASLSTTLAATESTATVSALLTAESAAAIATSLRAVASNVTDL